MGLPPTEHISLSVDIPCRRHYPGRLNEACSLVPLHRLRPSLCNSQVGSCNCFFGACSAFTHITACTLAESPSDPFHRMLRQLRCLCCRFDCYRVERTSSRAGVAPAEVQRLFTAHYYVNYPPRRLGQSATNREAASSIRLPGSKRLSFLVQRSWFDYRVESGVPANCSQETLGCQFTKAPLGLSFHAQTCRV